MNVITRRCNLIISQIHPTITFLCKLEEKNMKVKLMRAVLVVAFLFGTAGLSTAWAGNPFSDVQSTADGSATWDSDLINLENVVATGTGVYVAVLDTGLTPNWRDYFPKERVNTDLGTGFDQPVSFRVSKDNPCRLEVSVGQLHQTTWVGSTGSTHGTHVASTIIGYFYQSPNDAAQGYPLPPIVVRGIAPDVTVIPVKVLADYQVPATPKCPNPQPSSKAVFGTDEMVAAGINYATDLAIAGYQPMVVNMSLGGSELGDVEKAAIDRAVENGVIVVAAAGNEGEYGMGYPGAYAPVISAGSIGWTKEWLFPGDGPRYRMWWLQYEGANMLPGSGEVAEPTAVEDVYLSDFSSRGLPGQQLDILAPGSWVRGPYPGEPGFAHLPWWANGMGGLRGNNPGNFYYVGGTSMATPHVAAVAALLLSEDATLDQWDVDTILKSSALPFPNTGSRDIWDNTAPATITWDTDCDGVVCDPVGAGVLQADAALALLP
jgi:subtilisin family serine protease